MKYLMGMLDEAMFRNQINLTFEGVNLGHALSCSTIGSFRLTSRYRSQTSQFFWYILLNLHKTQDYWQEINKMHKTLRFHSVVKRKNPIPLHDNARSHVTRSTPQKLSELDYVTLPHPPAYRISRQEFTNSSSISSTS